VDGELEMPDGPDETHPDHDSGERKPMTGEDKRTIKLHVETGDMSLQCAEPHVRLKVLNRQTGEFEEAKSLTYEEMAPLSGKVSFLVPVSRIEEAMDALSSLMDTGAILVR
jgi:hypothetical protein